jgi:hypothetical protein
MALRMALRMAQIRNKLLLQFIAQLALDHNGKAHLLWRLMKGVSR